MIINVEPRYKPLVQLKGCCAACSILWIIFRRGFWVDQEIIAKEIKVKVLKKDLNLFSGKMLVAKNQGEVGTPDIIGKDAPLVNNFLKRHKIPLKMMPFKISKVKNPKEFIVKNIKNGNDIMASFCWKGLGYKRRNWGHVIVISEIDTKKDIVTVGDSSPDHSKFWKVKLAKLVKAMTPRSDGWERGFYIFSTDKL